MIGFTNDDLRRAYNLLDVPYSASPRLIKHGYRRIAKRWHPDRYRVGTPAHAEATQMMTRINEAYSLIENAPLLNRTAQRTAPPSYTPSAPVSRPSQRDSKPSVRDDAAPGQFWKPFWDVVSLSPILMRIVLFPVAFVAVWFIMTLFHWFPGLVGVLTNAATQSWLITLGVAIAICCGAAEKLWKFRRHWIVWVAFGGLLLLHFLVAVPISTKLFSYELLDGGHILMVLAVFEFAGMITAFNFITAPLEKARDLARLHSN